LAEKRKPRGDPEIKEFISKGGGPSSENKNNKKKLANQDYKV